MSVCGLLQLGSDLKTGAQVYMSLGFFIVWSLLLYIAFECGIVDCLEFGIVICLEFGIDNCLEFGIANCLEFGISNCLEFGIANCLVFASLHLEASGTRALNCFMKAMYASHMFVEGRAKDRLLASGWHLLQAASRVAVLSTSANEHRFPITPKHHMCYHIVATCQWMGDLAGRVLNPVCESCAMDEDYIGHLCRISRSVSPRLACLRTGEVPALVQGGLGCT